MLLYYCVCVRLDYSSQIDGAEILNKQVLGTLQRRTLIEVLPMLQVTHGLARSSQNIRMDVIPRLFIAHSFRCAFVGHVRPNIQAVDLADPYAVHCRAQLKVAGQDQRREIPLRVPAFNISLSSLSTCPLLPCGNSGCPQVP